MIYICVSLHMRELVILETRAENDVDGVLRRGDAGCVHWLMDSMMALFSAVIRSTQRRPHYGRR